MQKVFLRLFLTYWYITSACGYVEDGLLGYWPLDSHFVDVIHGHQDQFVYGGCESSFEESPIGGCLRLDGIDDFIEFGRAEEGKELDPLAISFWMKADRKDGIPYYTYLHGTIIEYREPGFVLGPGHWLPETLAIKEERREEWIHVLVQQIVIWEQGAFFPEEIYGEMYINGKLMPRVGRPPNDFSGMGVSYPVIRLGGMKGFAPFFRGRIDELLLWDRSVEATEVEEIYQAGLRGESISVLLQDDDEDGLPNVWETRMGLDPEIAEVDDDLDKDGLVNSQEYDMGTDPRRPDTDNDGLLDVVETGTWIFESQERTGTSPIRADTDDDGLLDEIEAKDDRISPLMWDSDGDGFGDGDELRQGSKPDDPSSKPDLSRGLKAYWSFDNSFEEQTNTYSMVYGPDESAVYDEGVLGGAIKLDGDDFVEVVGFANGEQMTADEFGFVGKEFSVAAWALLDNAFVAWPQFVVTQGEGRGWHLAAITSGAAYWNGWEFFVPERAEQAPVGQRSNIFLYDTDDSRWHHIVAIFRLPRGGYGSLSPSEAHEVYTDGIRNANMISISPRPKPRELRDEAGISSEGIGLRIGEFVGDPKRVGWRGLLDDLAIWERALTRSEARSIYEAAVNNGKSIGELLSPDSDRDGMPDTWETEHGLNPAIADEEGDLDFDQLTNGEEYQRRTDPNVADTDGDGLLDGVETHTGQWASSADTGTDPTVADTDGDGLLDSIENPEETFRVRGPSGTDPNVYDTDGDGVSDGVEAEYDSNPTNVDELPELGKGILAYWPLDGDTEDALGRFKGEARGSEPLKYETGRFGMASHFNGLDQGIEIIGGEARDFDFAGEGESLTASLWFRVEANPSLCDLSECVPSPGLLSKGVGGETATLEMHYERLVFNRARSLVNIPIGDGTMHHVVAVVNAQKGTAQLYLDGELIQTAKPKLTESENRLWIGAHPKDAFVSEKDIIHFAGLIDEVAIWKRPFSQREVKRLYEAEKSLGELADLSSVPDPERDPLDGDGDGLPDLWESANGLDLSTDDAEADPDQDGLNNRAEFQLGTNPQVEDTDGDGYLDSAETNTAIWLSATDTGTNPLLADSDGDGLPDGIENPDKAFESGETLGSDPNRIDTDGDGLTDDVEWHYGVDPSRPEEVPDWAVGLVAYWPMEESLIDLGPNRLDGAPIGAKEFIYQEGTFGSAVYLDGSQAVEIVGGHASAFDFTGKSMAVSLWFRADLPTTDAEGFENEQVLISKGDGPLDFNMSVKDGKVSFHQVEMEAPLEFGVLHNVVGIVDIRRNELRLYLDGEQVATGTPDLTNSGNRRLFLGAHPESLIPAMRDDRAYWTGLLDDVAFWERPLSHSEIRRLWEEGSSLESLAKLGIQAIDPSLDSDGDGETDLEEFYARTDPNDPNSRFRILSVERVNEGLRLRWSSTPATRYWIDYARSPAEGAWETIPLEIPSQGERTEIIDQDPERMGKIRGFYRIRVGND